MARTNMVSAITTHVHSAPNSPSKPSPLFHSSQIESGATSQSKMESVCLESLWQNKLENAGWSQRAKEQFSLSWANSTLTLYNRFLYFVWICVILVKRPRSMLNSASAALTCAYNSMGVTSLMHSPEIQRLLVALIKSGTKIPMCRSKVMPVDKFRMLFSRWPDNSDLTERQLRLKSLTLLALVTMLRPSDVAPKSVIYDADAGVVKSNIFSTDNVFLFWMVLCV